VLKSAQVPLHCWLIEVMETPTPVSALLHAGVVNAGGVLVLRFADVMLAAPGVLAALALLGGLTALWGAVVALTQPAVKTALAWSTVGQMGFMMLQLGLALFPMALLHIVAHSLYKAHAFLSAGGAVAEVKAARMISPGAAPEPARILAATGVAGAVYVAAAGALLVLGVPLPEQALGLGAALALGLMPLLAPAMAKGAQAGLPVRLGAAVAGVGAAWLVLHAGAKALAGGMLPEPGAATPGQIAALCLVIASFGLVAVAQAALPHWAGHPLARRLRVHLANGLYAGALLHRATGGYARAS
jgi:NAD(P)H-quinone oxidoreductase subunit 5